MKHGSLPSAMKSSAVQTSCSSIYHQHSPQPLSSIFATCSKLACVYIIDDTLCQRQYALNDFCHHHGISIRTVTLSLSHYEVAQYRYSLLQRMKTDNPFLVWCRLKGFGGSARDQHGNRKLHTLLVLCRHQIKHQRHFVIESHAANTMWQYQQLVAFGDEEHVRTVFIRYCNLGCRHPQSGEAVSGLCTLLTSYDLPSSTTCECNVPRDQHVRDNFKYSRHYENSDVHSMIPSHQQIQLQFVSLLLCVFISVTSQAPEVGLEYRGSADSFENFVRSL